MADNNFRSFRGRQAPAPERAGAPAAGGANDPLAELARLIGQSDPYAERQNDPQTRRHPAEEEVASGHEWADEQEIEQAYAAEGRHAQAPAMPRVAPLREYVPQSDEHEYEQESPVEQYYSGPSGAYVGYQDSVDTHGEARPVPDFLAGAPEDNHEFAEPEHEAGDTYAHDDYYQPSRRRRGGLVLVMAVLGLAVVGTASAFAYRTMFGGSLLPALPPIIKASIAPNKVMPNSGDAQAANSSQTGATNTAGAENLVSREEEPINIDQAKPAPKVVSTIPVTSGESAPLPPSVVAAIPPTQSAGLPAPVGPAPAVSASPNWPPAPMAAPPVTAAPAQPGPPANAANSAPAPASPPPAPKKIHTVTIRPDQAGNTDAASSPPPAARGASARANSPDGNAPLALVPGAGDAAPPAHPRRAPAPNSVASATPANASAGEAPAAAGYAVQVSSQHSETEAQSSFQAMRAKYPDLLGKREPIIRRADLGAKGIYYRALVGPFASAEEAAAMCSSLKAAGGNCIVQKN